MLFVSTIFPQNFKVRSLADVQYFCCHVLQPGVYTVPDVADSSRYYCLHKAEDGTVSLGSARYGTNPLTAEIPCCDDLDIYHEIYRIRKSINQHFFA